MKKLILAVMILIPMGLAAQSKSFNDLYTKYEGVEGFTCMNLSGDMLKSSMEMGGEEAAESLKDISSMTMIVTENASEEFCKEVKDMLAEGEYKSLLSLDSDGDKVEFYLAKGDAEKEDGEEKEMLLIVSSDGDYVIISMTGKGDPAEIMKQVNVNK